MPEPRAVREVVARVRTTLARRRMLKGGETVVVALSGGPDSLCLLHALHRLAPAMDLRLHVAHFDHRLRTDSAKDAAFAGRTATKLGIPATIRSADDVATPRGSSPEEAARDRRYGFLGELAESLGGATIATGHTLDDQAETVIMRVLAGTGTRGLGGIPPVRGRIIRPLIDVRRSETEAMCRALRLRPRVDPTNTDTAFRRNAIRAELMPLLAERFNVRTPEALARLADVARDEDALLDELAAGALEPDAVGGAVRIPVEALLALPPALQRRVVRRAAPVDAEHTEKVLQLCREGATGDRITLPATLNASLSYGSLLIGRTRPAPDAPDPVIVAIPGVTDLPLWSMQMRTWIENRSPGAAPDGRRSCVLDADRVDEPVVVRAPRSGDRFRPLGMRGEKRLGDFFTDAKVPRDERPRTPVLVSGGEVAWVTGHRPGDRFKVTRATRRYLWLEIEKGEQ